jgi:hypothetical protein
VHLLATISLNKQNQTDLSGELRQFQLIIDSLYMSIKTLTQYLQVVVMLVILVWPDLSQYTKHYNFSLPYGIVLPLLLSRHLEPLTTVFVEWKPSWILGVKQGQICWSLAKLHLVYQN